MDKMMSQTLSQRMLLLQCLDFFFLCVPTDGSADDSVLVPFQLVVSDDECWDVCRRSSFSSSFCSSSLFLNGWSCRWLFLSRLSADARGRINHRTGKWTEALMERRTLALILLVSLLRDPMVCA